VPYRSSLTAATFSPDGRFAALIVDSKELLVVGLPDATRLFSTAGTNFISVTISTTGVVAVVDEVESLDLRVKLWRSADWSPLPTIAFKSRIFDVALSADGQFVGLSGDDDLARIIRTASGAEVTRFAVSESAIPVFSPDSSLAALAGAGQVVRVFDLKTNRELSPIAHGEDTLLIAFTPDSRYLATVGAAFTRIHSATTGEEIARIANSAPVKRIEFSRDGTHVATTDEDNTRIWYWTSNDVAAAACQRLRRQLLEPQWPAVPGERFETRLARACNSLVSALK
jgi:WD40 repeat protein